MARLFFSVKFSETQQYNLLPYQQQALTVCPDGKAVDRENLHLTLFFLGDVSASQQQQQQLIDAAQQLRAPAFAVTLDHLGCFAKPKILYLAPSQIPVALAALQQQVAEVCRVEGFSDIHDKYRPHVTLARHSSYAGNIAVSPLTLTIAEFALYQSVHCDGRLQYLPLSSFSLL